MKEIGRLLNREERFALFAQHKVERDGGCSTEGLTSHIFGKLAAAYDFKKEHLFRLLIRIYT